MNLKNLKKTYSFLILFLFTSILIISVCNNVFAGPVAVANPTGGSAAPPAPAAAKDSAAKAAAIAVDVKGTTGSSKLSIGADCITNSDCSSGFCDKEGKGLVCKSSIGGGCKDVTNCHGLAGEISCIKNICMALGKVSEKCDEKNHLLCMEGLECIKEKCTSKGKVGSTPVPEGSAPPPSGAKASDSVPANADAAATKKEGILSRIGKAAAKVVDAITGGAKFDLSDKCQKNDECKSKFCDTEEKTPVCKSIIGGECKEDTNCQGVKGEVSCIDKTCMALGKVDATCSKKTPCMDGLKCVDKICTGEAEETDTAITPGSCANNDIPCPLGYQCNSQTGACEPYTPPPEEVKENKKTPIKPKRLCDDEKIKCPDDFVCNGNRCVKCTDKSCKELDVVLLGTCTEGWTLDSNYCASGRAICIPAKKAINKPKVLSTGVKDSVAKSRDNILTGSAVADEKVTDEKPARLIAKFDNSEITLNIAKKQLASSDLSKPADLFKVINIIQIAQENAARQDSTDIRNNLALQFEFCDDEIAIKKCEKAGKQCISLEELADHKICTYKCTDEGGSGKQAGCPEGFICQKDSTCKSDPESPEAENKVLGDGDCSKGENFALLCEGNTATCVKTPPPKYVCDFEKRHTCFQCIDEKCNSYLLGTCITKLVCEEGKTTCVN